MMLYTVFLITCLIIIVLAVVRQIWSKVHYRRHSLRGIEGVLFFIGLIKSTQQHRGMHSGLLNGKLEFKKKLPAIELIISDYYTKILKFEKSHIYPKSLSIYTPSKQWQLFIKNKTIDSAESFRVHSRLIARQLDALWDMSDEFSLTSNNQLNIRNLAQQLIQTLPELTEALGQIRALTVQVASKQAMSADKKLQLLFTLGKIEEHHQNLITPLPEETNKKLITFIDMIKQNTHNGFLSRKKPEQLFQDSTEVIDALFIFIQTGFDSLKVLIKTGKVEM